MAESRNIVGIHADRVTNTSSNDYPGQWPGIDDSWDLEKFKRDFKIDIKHRDPLEMNFDLINIDTSIANALRRIMIAEVPTVAVELVEVHANTGVIHDEILAQRIGQIPIRVDSKHPVAFFDKTLPEDERHSDFTTFVFVLQVVCERKKSKNGGPDEIVNGNVYAKNLKWKPFGRQKEWAPTDVTICNPDILITKLRPGQQIQIRAMAVVGQGSDHAKWSPVATASYRLLPTITITDPEGIKGAEAQKFQKCFPSGVIDIDENGKAVVADTRKDTVSREVLRHSEFQGRVKLGRVRDHFIFNVESVGQVDADTIFLQSIRILKEKTSIVHRALFGADL